MALGLVLGALSGGATGAAKSLAESEQFRQQQELERQRMNMQLAAQKAAEEYKNAPQTRFGGYLKQASGEQVPVTAGPVTTLDRAGAEAAGLTQGGITGDVQALRQKYTSMLADPTATAEQKADISGILDQLDRQELAQQQLMDQSVAGQARPKSSIEAIQDAIDRAIQAGDAQAAEAGKKMLADSRVVLGPDSALLDVIAGKPIYQSTRGAERAEIAAEAAAAKILADQEFKREQAEKERQFRREIAEGRTASSREIAELAAGAKAEKEANKPLPKAIVNELKDARDNATTMNRIKNQFKDDYASKGVFGIGAEKALGAKAILGVDKDSVDWWKNYRKNAELVERHAMFGASLTQGEKDAWASADISPGMDADVIKRNLSFREKLASKVLDNARQDYIDAGYNENRVNLIAGRDTSDVGGRKPEEKNVTKGSMPQGWSVTVR